MLTYEDVVKGFLKSAKNAGLNVYKIDHKIELTSLDREFICYCVPKENTPPHYIRAEVSFHWDSIMTAESVYGGNCSLYHDDCTECTHNDLEPNPFIELEIEYKFEVDVNIVDLINNELHKDVFSKIMQHENIPTIRWQLITDRQGNKRISEIWANHHWLIEFNNGPIRFGGICNEICQVLKEIEKLNYIKKK